MKIAGAGFEPRDLRVSHVYFYGPDEHSRLLHPAMIIVISVGF